LHDLAFVGHALAYGDLDGEDAPNRLARGDFFGGGEEGWDVVHVALDELDGGGFGGEFLCAGGGAITGDGEDSGVGGVAGDESVDDRAALFAGCYIGMLAVSF